MDEKLDKDYLATIGVDVTTVKVALQSKDIVTLSLWDLAGQDRFQKIRGQFYLGSVLGLLLFDVANEESFHNLNKWIEEAERSIIKPIPIFLIGNKIDLPDRVISITDMEQFKRKNKQIHAIYETSALTGVGIKSLFKTSAEFVYKQLFSEGSSLLAKSSDFKRIEKGTSPKSTRKSSKESSKKSSKKSTKKSSKKAIKKSTSKSKSETKSKTKKSSNKKKVSNKKGSKK